MKIIIEDHSYKADTVNYIIDGVIDAPKNRNGNVSVSYVGYCYNRRIDDCVFFLPKVVQQFSNDVDKDCLVFGKYKPEDIIDIDSSLQNNIISSEDYSFIYNLSIWIYRTIVEYNQLNPNNTIVKSDNFFSRLDLTSEQRNSTLLDILLSLVKFNNENQNFFMFAVKRIHSGYNKIDWNKTISKQQAYFQGNTPIYLYPENRKRQIDFDEELFVIFFSILKYAEEKYGFHCTINFNYKLLTGAAFENLLNGFGKVRLLRIKYKYFSDKALELWNLCYSFFSMLDVINSSKEESDYLLVKDFYVVFESIIDDLLGDKDVLKPLKENKDGKIIDHIYPYASIINQDDDIYYIGDSKYYKIGNQVQAYSEYKQYTYAKNVIQYNLDLFLNGKPEALRYRDEITEGYNVTPNFFISAEITADRSYTNPHLNHREDSDKSSRHFDNRLFDRDTLWLAHYDINFLYVIALYASRNVSEKNKFKNSVRKKFRKVTIDRITANYNFYVLKVKAGYNYQEVIDENFRLLNGKLFCPNSDGSITLLALDNDLSYQSENENVLRILDQYFICRPYKLGENPYMAFKYPEDTSQDMNALYEADFSLSAEFSLAAEQNTLSYIRSISLSSTPDTLFLVGCCKDKSHFKWMCQDVTYPIVYNIREGSERPGAIIYNEKAKSPSYLILYNFFNELDYRVFTITVTYIKTENEMLSLGYKDPKGSYIIYELGTEVRIQNLNVLHILMKERLSRLSHFLEGAPLFLTGKEIVDCNF